MNIDNYINQRSNNKCELCGSTIDLSLYTVPPETTISTEHSINTCVTCKSQLEEPASADPNHWRCLNDSMWSEIPAVQVIAWRVLHKLKHEGWPQDLLDMMYLDDATVEWAKSADYVSEESSDAVQHMDSNGVVLQSGDNVVLIKDLNVKGSSLVAKRGTAVRGISLVHNNSEQIEGKVSGQQIVLLTKFVKKNS